MTEGRFISKNKYLWDRYQNMLDGWKLYSPNELGQAYLSVCSDLAYAQSHYPETQVCKDLNALALQFHHILYRRQPQRWTELLHFFKHTVPMSFYRSRHFLLFSLCLFLIGEVIGVMSQCLDKDYFQAFFGDYYHSETMNNIKSGNPMGIYGSEGEVEMYFHITLNNMDSVTLFPFDIERDEQGCHWRNSGSFFQSELLIRETSLHFWLNQFTLIKYGKRFL